jgi:hypothetical protein
MEKNNKATKGAEQSKKATAESAAQVQQSASLSEKEETATADKKTPEAAEALSVGSTGSAENFTTSDGQVFSNENLSKIHQKHLDKTAASEKKNAEELAAYEAKAENYFKKFESKEEVHFTSDGQVFFDKSLAKTHQRVIDEKIAITTIKRK